MNPKTRILFIVLLVVLVWNMGCNTTATNQSENPDLLLINGKFHTVNDQQPTVEALAIKGNKIQQLGTTTDINALVGPNTKTIDLNGATAIPGFIEGHGHFAALGYSLIRLNFLETKNWEEVLEMVRQKVKTAKPGAWIEGRGWHQEKWDQQPDKTVQNYPTHDELSAIAPNNPVLLRHASGHSAFANKKAMDLSGISRETANPAGGLIIRDGSGQATGVFEERAMDALYLALKEYQSTLSEEELEAEFQKAVAMAQEECLRNGITSFQDAGSDFKEIAAYKKLAEDKELDLRLWVMLRRPYEETKTYIDQLPILNAGDHFFTVRAIKSQVDGALGAHGAWLLQPYSDKPGFVGQNTTPVSEVANMAKLCLANNLQLCVHAIGDRANREVLDIYSEAFKKNKTNNNLRWRIEHAQHVNEADIPRFAELGVIASMQGIHCTSDAPFVEKRLGEHRAGKESYAWRTFLDSGAKIANGTDAPVEKVSPIESYYASVTRKRKDGMEFFPEQKMTRVEALRTYTLDNAYAAFEEKEKGSLEVGKLADITILSKDILKVSDSELLQTEILYTIVNGEIKYQKK